MYPSNKVGSTTVNEVSSKLHHRRSFLKQCTKCLVYAGGVLTGACGCPVPTNTTTNGSGGNNGGGGGSTDWRTRYPALSSYLSNFVTIPAGSFSMGMIDFEEPVHTVTLSSFRMGVTPVTVAVWKEYAAATKVTLPLPPTWGFIDDHPVTKISYDLIAGADGNGGFLKWIIETTGAQVRLPTEAQWEYAARGGKSDLIYPWGNSFDANLCWCSTPTNSPTMTASVFRSSRNYVNVYGLTDIVGNVRNWCYDISAPYSSEPQVNPTGAPGPSIFRALRGMSYRGTNAGMSFSVAFRDSTLITSGDVGFGFRLVIPN